MADEAFSSRLPPYSEEAERGVLGSVLADAERVIDVCLEKQLKPDSFFIQAHQLLFEHLVDMHADNRAIDLLTVTEKLKSAGVLDKVGGYDYLERMVDFTPTSAHAEHYIEIVHERYVRRRVINCAREAVDNCYNPDMDSGQVVSAAEQSFFSIGEQRSDGMERWDAALDRYMKEINAIADGKATADGIPTGFKDIDSILHGLHKTDIVILAARPSMGKTSLAMNIVENIALGKGTGVPLPVAVFSLEMSREQLIRRMLFCNARVPMHHAVDHISVENHGRLLAAADRLRKAQIYVDDTAGLEAVDLRSRARRLKRQYDIQFIMIDYLQLMNYSKFARDGRQREVGAISGTLKAMAKELEVPVIVLSQLSRNNEQRGSKDMAPRLSDLRDSGSIEQDADVVCMLRRPSRYKDIEGSDDDTLAILDIAKHRNGPTGEVKLNFFGQYTRFEDRAEVDEPYDL